MRDLTDFILHVLCYGAAFGTLALLIHIAIIGA